MDQPQSPQKMPFVMDMEPGTYFWCACGRSENQPFCDGSHKGSSFSPKREEITEVRKVAWCGCKHSGNSPFCDGTHSKL